jgi:hypothetical protein
MLHACLYTICLVFCYTSWRFYAFSRTNLLTRCHSASSLFSTIFVFQKSYTGNILGIGRKKSQSSYFFPTWDRVQSRDGGVPEGSRTMPWCGPLPSHAGLWCGPLAHLLMPPFHYLFPSTGKPKCPDQFSTKHTASRRRRRLRLGGSRSSSRHPTREGNHRRRPSSSPCLPPEWCVSSLPWTMGP